MPLRRNAALIASLTLAVAASWPAPAQEQGLQRRVEAALAAAQTGTRFGLVVATAEGREIVAIDPEQRFVPASNTKLLTTAAAFAALPGLDRPDVAGGTAVRLDGPDAILRGHGDARMSSEPDCAVDCLAALADAVAARTRTVRNVVGDDSLFPDQRWSPGMSWNNIPTSSGTAVSALTLDDNVIALRVSPGAVGRPPALTMLPYFSVDNRAATVGQGPTDLRAVRLPGGRRVRLTGTIAAGAGPEELRLGIDDPAEYAAWRFKSLLEERGVTVTGSVDVRHRPLGPADDPAQRNGAPAPRPPEPEPLARLVPPPLAADLTEINKDSQNLHADLLLRRLGRIEGSGSIADGVAVIAAMLERAGVPRTGWDLSDGSGMSTYNRLSPRAVVTFLRWAAVQPWGEAWRATLPVAGVDGTLGGRFRDTALAGRLFAKTGTLNATNALSGYMVARSGRTLVFSIYANDVPGGASATAIMDAALVLIAEAN
ncbi:MAG TPA: D-alanyl-D-alanine carboxypeptidase/D-alanyl-D-alanine-endopeptidase [Allosphingosinicella sp.]|jgi:D-alanyl-D-alanine carboxypeptidase/D-alanyl-D-alanine-endopeptidase (penicillin-binding protein 4)